MSKKLIFVMAVGLSGCAGMKVVNPNEGTLALDSSGKLVATYTCNLSAMGKTFSAVAKSEAEARQEAFKRCQDRTLISNCNGKFRCEKN